MDFIKTFIPKQNPELPDAYGITFHYFDGSKEEFEVASHKLVDVMRLPNIKGGFEFAVNPSPFIELTTKDNLIVCRQLSGFKGYDFDSRFSKIIEIRNKEMREKAKQEVA